MVVKLPEWRPSFVTPVVLPCGCIAVECCFTPPRVRVALPTELNKTCKHVKDGIYDCHA
jgi:hypothetical protein